MTDLVTNLRSVKCVHGYDDKISEHPVREQEIPFPMKNIALTISFQRHGGTFFVTTDHKLHGVYLRNDHRKTEIEIGHIFLIVERLFVFDLETGYGMQRQKFYLICEIFCQRHSLSLNSAVSRFFAASIFHKNDVASRFMG